ncbi:MAG: U32 family peptidase [Clostridiales bacterium]|jgi:putative protease|nr:U32 family peptidase [Clostridiales bacterium]
MRRPSDKVPELLAPAGSFDALCAAVHNGADAVYLGAGRFSARAKAENFAEAALQKAVSFCRPFGVKAYLAVNTLFKPDEYDEALALIGVCADAGIDAVIVQDLVFLKELTAAYPAMPVHISTQAGVHNVYGAAAVQKLGASRVILSRETGLSDIREISRETELEIEVFLHGALCVAFSGNCYFSSLAAGLSGNRGRCLQLCRKSYRLAGQSGYWLSTADLSLSERIGELREAGVRSFKLEGRMRRPEYVGGAVRYYRELLAGGKPDRRLLTHMYRRGTYTQGHLFEATADVIYPLAPGHIGAEAGVVAAVRGQDIEVKPNAAFLDKPGTPFIAGDGFKILRKGRETGRASCQKPGTVLRGGGDILPGDRVNLTTDAALSGEVLSARRLIDVDIRLKLRADFPAEAAAAGGGQTVECRFDDIVPQEAVHAPLTTEELRNSFERCGDFFFRLARFEIEGADRPLFLRKAAQNELRRRTCRALFDKLSAPPENRGSFSPSADTAEIVERRYREVFAPCGYPTKPTRTGGSGNRERTILIAVDDLDILDTVKGLFDYAAYYPASYDADIGAAFEKHNADGLFLGLPPVMRGRDLAVMRKHIGDGRIKNVIADNIGAVELFRNKNILLGPFMNVIRPLFPAQKILSVEFDGRDPGDGYVYAFGRFPIMTLCHCPQKSAGKRCGACGDPPPLCDERGNTFPIKKYKLAYCYHQLLNCLPLNLTKTPDFSRFSHIYIDLLGYSAKACYTVLSDLKQKGAIDIAGTAGYRKKNLE